MSAASILRHLLLSLQTGALVALLVFVASCADKCGGYAEAIHAFVAAIVAAPVALVVLVLRHHALRTRPDRRHAEARAQWWLVGAMSVVALALFLVGKI
jgi:hypothetical protein